MPKPRKPTETEIEALLPKYGAAVDTWVQGKAPKMKASKITGIDIGYVYKRGKRTNEIGVRTHTLPNPRKGASGATARSSGGALHGASLKVRYSRGTPALAQNVLPSDPVQPGVSVSSARSRGGTIGLIVFDSAGKECVLSCHHVLSSDGKPELVLQPAIYLGGTALDPDHWLGRVQAFIDDSDGDAAVASIENRQLDHHQFRSGVLIESAEMPSIGDVVEKDGMGTGVRCGFVDGIGLYDMGGPNGPMKGFRIVRGSRGGECGDDLSQHADSGSVWYRKSDDKEHGIGLGLHVGGDITEPDESIRPAIACFLTSVLARLEVTIKP